MKDTNVNILGSKYHISFKNDTTDLKLKDMDGYTDVTTKEIVIDNYIGSKLAEDTVSNTDSYVRQVLRHELLHAILYESGLHANAIDGWAVNEEIIDWMAIQFPKIFDIFQKVGCI